MKIALGKVWVNFKKMLKDGSMEVEMTQAFGGVKGTTFVCEVVADGTSTLKVIEGSVEFTAKADGKKAIVQGGNMISADNRGLGALAKFDTAAETAIWDKIKAKTAVKATAAVKAKAASTSYIFIIAGVVALVVTAFVIVILINKKRNVRDWCRLA